MLVTNSVHKETFEKNLLVKFSVITDASQD